MKQNHQAAKRAVIKLIILASLFFVVTWFFQQSIAVGRLLPTITEKSDSLQPDGEHSLSFRGKAKEETALPLLVPPARFNAEDGASRNFLPNTQTLSLGGLMRTICPIAP